MMMPIMKAALIGCAITALPQLLASIPAKSKVIQVLHGVSSYLLTPGVTVCLVFNSWRVHDVNFTLMLLFNAVFYSVLAYGGLRALKAWRTSHLCL